MLLLTPPNARVDEVRLFAAAGKHILMEKPVERTTKVAEEIVATGEADAVMVAREMLRDPHFALRAAAELGVAVDYVPKQYLRAPYPGPSAS